MARTVHLRERRLSAHPRTLSIAVLFAAILACLVVPVAVLAASDDTEVLRYEVTWNGSKAGHGDISTKRDGKTLSVTAQAVSDGMLKKIVEMWSRIQATISAKTLQPLSYNFAFKTNLGSPELVTLTFDHAAKVVQVDKQRGTERENHAEQFSGLYDPISAAFLLRNQKDYTKPMFVDIFDGKDKSRLFVTYAGNETLKIPAGLHPAVCLNLRLMKLTGDRKEVGNGKLWISDDQHHVPLCLTSSPLVGTIKFELVQLVRAQL